MAYYRPQRHQGRPSRYDDDFAPPEPVNSYEPYDDGEPLPPRSRYPEAPLSPPRSPPPRRHKSERRRRRPSPGPYYPDEPMMASRAPEPHSRSRKHESERRGRSAGPDRRTRDLSPPPFGPPPDSPRRKARSARADREPRYEQPPREYRPPREPRPGREMPIRMKREPRPDRDFRDERAAPMPDPYERDPYERDPYARGPPPRQHQGEPRKRRPRTWAPEPDSPRHSRTARPPSPRSKSRPRGRSARRPDSDDDGDNDGYYAAGAAAAGAAGAAAASHRRPRSQTRDHRGRAPARPSSRGRPPTTQKTRGGPSGRRNSMPASTQARAAWWQNPLVQAGARTAFTAGAQAAMKSRNDPSPWLGPKGAKVATAALGAALVDGFMGQKHPGSTRQKLMREGVDLAQTQAVKGASRHKSSHRH